MAFLFFHISVALMSVPSSSTNLAGKNLKLTVFRLLFFQINYFCILFNSFVVDVRILVINARWTILDTANALKTMIFPSNVKFRFCHSLRTFSMIVMCFRKISSFSVFLLYKKWIPECQSGSFQCTNSSKLTLRFIRF